MGYLWQTDTLICYDKINPTQYIFHDDTETCTPVYTEYLRITKLFYESCAADIEKAKQTREYGLDMKNHPNWFRCVLYFLAELRFTEYRASRRSSVFCTAYKLGQVQRVKTQTYDARHCPALTTLLLMDTWLQRSLNCLRMKLRIWQINVYLVLRIRLWLL